jgi:hypothetical protein
MSEDQLIAKLMSETFSKHEDSRNHLRSISSNSQFDFNQRRAYSKMGVRPIEGEWLSESLLRFYFNGLTIDLPVGHRPFGSLKTRNATLVEKEKSAAFISVISNAPILLFWDSREAKVNPVELVGLVRGYSKLKNAA